jgi:formyl-CoA transferase
VLDLCIILAGPTCGRTLAEYGAEIIKIDSWFRPPTDRQLHDVGRGKRSICLDITKPTGLETFYRLVDTADVVLGGFRKGVAERLGIGYEQLRERKPDIVYLAINAFGQDGSWANRPGYEQNAQAATGVQIRNGGRGETPLHSPYTFNDYGTGLMGAYAVMLALLKRRQTGKGQFVHTSLAQTGSTFSSPFLIDHDGYERNEVEGRHAQGFDALNGLYETADGWLALADANWQTLMEIKAFAHLSEREEFATDELRRKNDSLLSDAICEVLVQKGAEDWLSDFRLAGIKAARNSDIAGILSDDYTREHELIVGEDTLQLGKVLHAGVAPRMSETQPVLGATPTFGEETEAVLLELGYEVEEIDALRAEEIIPPLA